MTNGLADGIVDSRLLDFADEDLQGQLRLHLDASITYVVSLPGNLDSFGIDCTNNPDANSRAWKRMPTLGVSIRMLDTAKALWDAPVTNTAYWQLLCHQDIGAAQGHAQRRPR